VGLSKSTPPPPPPYNPQILYTEGSKGGSTATIYAANADGTDAVSLYSTGNIRAGAASYRLLAIEVSGLIRRDRIASRP